MRLINKTDESANKVLFLGYSESETVLIDHLVERDCELWHASEPIFSLAGYTLVVSFGYRHLISAELLGTATCPVINLHMSYLPWNRGAHPNFWSFFDCTPSGVSIHLIDEGIDTGPILYQRYVNFADDQITFEQTYQQLFDELETLFLTHLTDLLSGQYEAVSQRRKGSFHLVSDLPSEFSGWGALIQDEVIKLDQLLSLEPINL